MSPSESAHQADLKRIRATLALAKKVAGRKPPRRRRPRRKPLAR